ncbi:MAG: glycosyltransferase family 4 protein [Acidobacteriota bacterium]|nr:glycosyltransferase family 4 protein [Acidobacteriota bacterium]
MLKEAGFEAWQQLQEEGLLKADYKNGGRPRMIAILPYFLPRSGGVEHHTYQLARALEQRGFSITVLTQRLPGTPEHELLGETNVYRFGTTAEDRGRREAYKQILQRILHEPAAGTVLYLCLSVGKEFHTELMLEILAVARQRRIPRIVRIPSSGRVTELAMANPARLLEVRHANRVIALNAGIRDELVRMGCDPVRIINIPNGVLTELFQPAVDNARVQIRARLGACAADRVFIAPSRWAPKKRIPELIGCWQELERSVEAPIKLWVVGDDRYEVKRGVVSKAVMAALADASVDGVRLFGGRPHHEMVPFYQGADAYISLSTQEGQSNALLEAMACGLPIVAPETQAVTQIITAEENGFLFKPGDPCSALAAMRRCMEAPLAELKTIGQRNRALITKCYTVDLMADRFMRLLHEMLQKGDLDAYCH